MLGFFDLFVYLPPTDFVRSRRKGRRVFYFFFLSAERAERKKPTSLREKYDFISLNACRPADV
jgi:hypothetical protein